MSDIKFAKVTLPKEVRDGTMPMGVSIGRPAEVLFDGKPFPWATTDGMIIKIERHDAVKLTLTMPIKLVDAE